MPRKELSASNAARFLNVFLSVIENPDKEIIVDHERLGLTPETCISRLRDAVLAMKTGLVDFPSIDSLIFADAWKGHYVTLKNGEVRVRCRKLDEEEDTPAIAHIQESYTCTIENPTAAHLEAVALLLSDRILSGPVLLRGTTELALQLLSSRFDISYSEHSNSSFILF